MVPYEIVTVHPLRLPERAAASPYTPGGQRLAGSWYDTVTFDLIRHGL